MGTAETTTEEWQLGGVDDCTGDHELYVRAQPHGYHTRHAGSRTRRLLTSTPESTTCGRPLDRWVTGSREELYWVSSGVPVAGPGVVAPRELGWEIG